MNFGQVRIVELSAKEYKARLKKKYDKDGLLALEPMERLELVLFYCMPVNNVQKCANALVSHFGSVEAVFNATFESLTSVPEMSENAATFLRLIPGMCIQYSKSNAENSILLGRTAVKEYFKAQYYGIERELVMLTCVDSKLRVIKHCTISDGNTSFATLNTKLLVSEVLESGCTGCFIAHNHPQGKCYPSNDDNTLTKSVTGLLETLNVKLIDHIIVGTDGVWTYSSAGMLM